MTVGAVKYWFNGLPLDGLSNVSADSTRYWFTGLPYDTLAPSAGPSGITATVNVTQANNTLVATATVVTPPPTTQAQVYVDIRTAIRSFTIRKRMF